MRCAPALAAKHVPVVDVGKGTAADFKKAGDISGKLICSFTPMCSRNGMTSSTSTWTPPPVIDAAVKGKAKAIAFIATREHDILYRHTNAAAGEIDRLAHDRRGARRRRAHRHGSWLRGIRFGRTSSIPNKIGGPITASNVIAELRGSEKPDEFVILGAHLDSWELGTGALDNGCNAALVIDALRTIKASGLRPKRTIRFILFSGEEEGMMGSRAYATAHRNELDKAAGVVVIDAGIGRVTGFSAGRAQGHGRGPATHDRSARSNSALRN